MSSTWQEDVATLGHFATRPDCIHPLALYLAAITGYVSMIMGWLEKGEVRPMLQSRPRIHCPTTKDSWRHNLEKRHWLHMCGAGLMALLNYSAQSGPYWGQVKDVLGEAKWSNQWGSQCGGLIWETDLGGTPIPLFSCSKMLYQKCHQIACMRSIFPALKMSGLIPRVCLLRLIFMAQYLLAHLLPPPAPDRPNTRWGLKMVMVIVTTLIYIHLPISQLLIAVSDDEALWFISAWSYDIMGRFCTCDGYM